MRILGVDPGLTRLGLGVVDIDTRRRLALVDVRVARSSAGDEMPKRLDDIMVQVEAVFDEFQPQVVAMERVFAQHNVRTVMGVAQVSGVVALHAQRLGLAVALYTPSEVKAAVTGHGRAEKSQIGFMVQRLLQLQEVPQPADAADALAIAITHGLRGHQLGAASTAATAAQKLWASAQQQATPARRRA